MLYSRRRCDWCGEEMSGPFWMVKSIWGEIPYLVCEPCRDWFQGYLFSKSDVEEAKPLT